MKSSKPKNPSKRVRQLLKKQVQEYVDRYYPQMGDVAVDISPAGTAASVSFQKKPQSLPVRSTP